MAGSLGRWVPRRQASFVYLLWRLLERLSPAADVEPAGDFPFRTYLKQVDRVHQEDDFSRSRAARAAAAK